MFLGPPLAQISLWCTFFNLILALSLISRISNGNQFVPSSMGWFPPSTPLHRDFGLFLQHLKYRWDKRGKASVTRTCHFMTIPKTRMRYEMKFRKKNRELRLMYVYAMKKSIFDSGSKLLFDVWHKCDFRHLLIPFFTYASLDFVFRLHTNIYRAMESIKKQRPIFLLSPSLNPSFGAHFHDSSIRTTATLFIRCRSIFHRRTPA